MDKYKALTSKGKEAYLEALTEIGWFDYPQNDRVKMAEHLADLKETIDSFYILSHMGVDGEEFYSGDAYVEVLEDMAKFCGFTIVSAALEYHDIEPGEDELTGTVVTPNNSYECMLEEMFPLFDMGFIEFANEILEGENIEGRFYMLPGVDAWVQLLFVPPHIYDQAIEVGILPDDPNYFFEEY